MVLGAIESFIRAREWPTDDIDAARERMRAQVQASERRIRNARAEEAQTALEQNPTPPPQPEVYYRIPVRLTTGYGEALGSIPIDVPREPVPTIETLLERLNARFDELGLPFPPREYLRVIAAGREYPNDMPIVGDIANMFKLGGVMAAFRMGRGDPERQF
jgi:hypothetical protein